MYRTRATRRQNNINKAIRKKKISDQYVLHSFNDETGDIIWSWYNNLHQYSKNKIHCSCPICRKKTKATHRGLTWAGSGRYDYKIADRRKQLKLDNSFNDYFFE